MEWVDITNECTFNKELSFSEKLVLYRKGLIYFDCVFSGATNGNAVAGQSRPSTLVFEIPEKYSIIGVPIRYVGHGGVDTHAYVMVSNNKVAVEGSNINLWCAINGMIPLN